MCNCTDIVFVCNFISVSSFAIIIEYIGHKYIASRGFYYMDILLSITSNNIRYKV